MPRRRRTTTRAVGEAFHPSASGRDRKRIGAINARVLRLLPARRRTQLLARPHDGDTTDVEVYGSKKQDAVYNYQGQRAYRPHIAFLGRRRRHAGRD